MAKTEITMTKAKRWYPNMYRCGYCDLYWLYTEPRHYNKGVYGWNCDIYVLHASDGTEVAISTGYRNMRGDSIPHEMLKRYKDEWDNLDFAERTSERRLAHEMRFVDELIKF